MPTAADIDRLSKNVPYQEAGRVSEKEISVSRANRSVRLWEHFVDALASGRQPDAEKTDAVGYLMRTTAVYGSGKLGAADWEIVANRPELCVPFHVEMLSVYLTRVFVRDLVNHMARKEAITRVRSVATASVEHVAAFRRILRRSEVSVANWRSEHPIQIEKLSDLRSDLEMLNAFVGGDDLINDNPWDRLVVWSENHLSEEGQELVASLILEPYGNLVDDLADNDPDAFLIDGSMRVGETHTGAIRAKEGARLQGDGRGGKRKMAVKTAALDKIRTLIG